MAKKKAAKTLLPDEIRCRRSDGRGWRCSRRIMDGMTLCEVHYDQRRRHELKQKVPDNLKLQKESKKAIITSKKPRITQTKKMPLSEIVEKAVRVARLKRGDKKLKLLRDYLKMVLEAKKKKNDDGMEPTTLMLPAGEMTISKRNPDINATRTFRSKKIEPSIFRTLD